MIRLPNASPYILLSNEVDVLREMNAFLVGAKSPMHSLSLMKDSKFPGCGRMTGKPHLTLSVLCCPNSDSDPNKAKSIQGRHGR